MNCPTPFATLPLPKSINLPLRRGVLLVPLGLALAWFVLSPAIRAVTPAPDGGYTFQNTAEGTNALFKNTTGSHNTATGDSALFNNTTGNENTANGFGALFRNTTGSSNTAIGVSALNSNSTGFQNTAEGANTLSLNTTGINNTANGANALFGNSSGSQNTANGVEALINNTTGSNNTADGFDALLRNTTGINNMASGVNSLFSNTTGNSNTANGINALLNNTTGKSNIALGASAGVNLTTGNNNIDIGAPGVGGESSKIRIGKVGTQNGTFIAGIHGVTVASAVGVVIDANGHLGIITSSARFKEAIKPMDKASEAILALKPVTFRYKQELDPDGVPQFGLIAEQVENVDPDLVMRDEHGKVNTVRYDAINAMLLNEFLKEHCKVEEQETTIAELKSNSAKQAAMVAKQQKQIEALTATMQKVSEKIELNRTIPHLVVDRR